VDFPGRGRSRYHRRASAGVAYMSTAIHPSNPHCLVLGSNREGGSPMNAEQIERSPATENASPKHAF
jgi:hypothetical protein